MESGEKAKCIAEILDRLFPEPEVGLIHRDPYTLLVATVLSAHSTDRAVNAVTPALFALAPDPAAMVRLGAEAIAAIVRPCGLAPTKARHIVRLSQRLLADHGGRVPAAAAALEALPGVGHKTAAVVLSQGFGLPAFPVDTHIHRLARRWGLAGGRSPADTERALKALFPPESWRRLHLQLIFFGRRYCPARGHDAPSCPICSWAAGVGSDPTRIVGSGPDDSGECPAG